MADFLFALLFTHPPHFPAFQGSLPNVHHFQENLFPCFAALMYILCFDQPHKRNSFPFFENKPLRHRKLSLFFNSNWLKSRANTLQQKFVEVAYLVILVSVVRADNTAKVGAANTA